MKIQEKPLDLSYLCPHCKSHKEPRKRFGGLYSEKKIFTCVDCTHEFEEYELSARKQSMIFERKQKALEEDYRAGKINDEEFYKATVQLFKA